MGLDVNTESNHFTERHPSPNTFIPSAFTPLNPFREALPAATRVRTGAVRKPTQGRLTG